MYTSPLEICSDKGGMVVEKIEFLWKLIFKPTKTLLKFRNEISGMKLKYVQKYAPLDCTFSFSCREKTTDGYIN